MKTIAIVGAGRVGLSCAKILSRTAQLPVIIVDASETALERARVDLPEAPAIIASGYDALLAAFRRHLVETVICATPFSANVEVAKAAFSANASYIDFTEDAHVASQIKNMNARHVSVVPQTGLAPGLISYIGLSLFDGQSRPDSLHLRVGALPRASFGDGHYAITWSPEGLVNEYLRPVVRKADGKIEIVEPLDHRERLILDGVTYEAFSTSGGIGDLEAYASIPTVDYKTLRYPGHLDFIRRHIFNDDGDFDQKVKKTKIIFPTTRDDLVVMAAFARTTDGQLTTFTRVIYPIPDTDMTALELTTAGTGASVAELISEGHLPVGFLTADKIRLSDLKQTESYQLIRRQMAAR